MAIDEASRHRLYDRLQEVLGTEEATILMEHLPPVGWADVATKRDLDALAVATKRDLDASAERNRMEHEALKATFDSLGQSMETMEQKILATTRAEINQQTRTMIFAMSSTVLAVGGLAFAAARLT